MNVGGGSVSGSIAPEELSPNWRNGSEMTFQSSCPLNGVVLVTEAKRALTARDVGPSLDLMREVFAEYGVPLELDATEPLSRAMGREIGFVPVPVAEIRKVSDDYATMLEWFDRVGYDVDIAALAKESGIRPTPFAEWASTMSWAPAAASR